MRTLRLPRALTGLLIGAGVVAVAIIVLAGSASSLTISRKQAGPPGQG